MARGRPIGMKLSDESKQKISNGRMGCEHTMETKDKISESVSKYWRDLDSDVVGMLKQYEDDPEAYQWLLDHKDEIDDDPTFYSEQKRRNKRKLEVPGHIPSYFDNLRINDLTPETLVIMKDLDEKGLLTLDN